MSRETTPIETVELVHAERGTRITVAAEAAEVWRRAGYELPAVLSDLDPEGEPSGEPDGTEVEPEPVEGDEVEAEPTEADLDPEPAPSKRCATGKRGKK